MFSPGQNISIDESTIAFKGRVIFKRYNPQKPTKWGIRVYTVADSETAFICGFVPYFGKPTTDSLVRPDIPFKTRIVLHLIQKIQYDCPAEGRHAYTDRFCTSLDLASESLTMKTHTTGTIVPNRKNLPPEVSTVFLFPFFKVQILMIILLFSGERPPIAKKLKKVDILALKKKDITVVAWKDKRPVLIMRTFHESGTADLVRKKAGGAEEEVTKPVAVQDYTTQMGGVDRADHFCATYNFARKLKKKWQQVFFFGSLKSALSTRSFCRTSCVKIGRKEK